MSTFTKLLSFFKKKPRVTKRSHTGEKEVFYNAMMHVARNAGDEKPGMGATTSAVAGGAGSGNEAR